ncbi:hypothetical protein DPMN_078027 [Dreissena polymorpha]|uniref:Uncharacterized protein n=1 Tax=Dreissena polymorpha TaxID=45954 RepID=A0A9D3YQF1_DREPO|nr:hypothetical protein DPMN_078027 [Dreissena polymorpha]
MLNSSLWPSSLEKAKQLYVAIQFGPSLTALCGYLVRGKLNRSMRLPSPGQAKQLYGAIQ